VESEKFTRNIFCDVSSEEFYARILSDSFLLARDRTKIVREGTTNTRSP